jgi:hypothetical protein
MRHVWIALVLTACDGPEEDVIPTANADGDCLDDQEEADLGTDPSSADGDGDGLGDCEEVEAGTDPNAEDGDGDGISDPDELDCASDPNDASDVCYGCGWAQNDPGDLVSTGSEVGDVIANLDLVDQCGDNVQLWDLAGEYHILFMTASW